MEKESVMSNPISAALLSRFSGQVRTRKSEVFY